jgi:cell wall-associated NlpC family hydrolase
MHSHAQDSEHIDGSVPRRENRGYGQAASRLQDAAVSLEEAAIMLTQAAALLDGDGNANDRDGNGHPRSLPEWVDQAVQWARNTVNNPDAEYEYGGTGPLKFDCSGFTMKAFAAGGKQLDRTARQQYSQADVHVPRAQARPGDLVFWSSNSSGSAIYHVALVISQGKIAHARNKDEDLSITGINYSPQNMLDVAGRFH